MSIRLSKIAKELNVGVSTAVEFLSKKGFNVDGDNSNYKLTDEEENLLRMEFYRCGDTHIQFFRYFT